MRRSIVCVFVLVLGALPVCGCHDTGGLMDFNECFDVCCRDGCEQRSLYDTKAAALKSIALAYADLGLYESAFQVVERIEHGYSKAMTMARISNKLKHAGYRFQSTEVSCRALQEIERIEHPFPKVWALLTLCDSRGLEKAQRMDMLAIASHEAESIEKVTQKNILLVEIAERAAALGIFDEALRTVDSIERSGFKAKALARVAGEYTEIGRRGRAFELLARAVGLIEEVEDPVVSSWSLKAIAGGYLAAGECKQALEIVQGIQERGPKGMIMRDAARSYVERGEWERAMVVILTIEDLSIRAQALADMAWALWEEGRTDKADELLEQALQAAGTVDVEIQRTWSIERIIDVYVRTGKYDQALELIGRVNSAFSRLKIMAEVAGSLRKAGYDGRAEDLLTQALELIGTVEDSSSKVSALAYLAHIYSRTGRGDEAVALLDQALVVVESIGDESRRFYFDA